MSSALKCNRCHKCFDPLDMKKGELLCRFSNPFFISAEDYSSHKFTKDLLGTNNSETKIDLCPECAEGFSLYMEGNPLAVKDNSFDQPDIGPAEPRNYYKELDELAAKVRRKMEKFAKDI